MKHSIRLVALASLVLAACSGNSTPDRMTIAVIPKGTSHVFWQSIHAGAQKAATELGVSIAWRGPLREDDRDSQVAEVENAVGRGVSGIVLAPLDDAALVAPVSAAMRQKIPVVIIDSGLKGDDYVSFVATDNEAGGRIAGESLATMIGNKGRVVLLRYAEGVLTRVPGPGYRISAKDWRVGVKKLFRMSNEQGLTSLADRAASAEALALYLDLAETVELTVRVNVARRFDPSGTR